MIKLLTLCLSVGLLTASVAGPVPTTHVSADAKWLLHVDLDALRTTKIGAFLTKEFLEKRFEKMLKQAEAELGTSVPLDTKKIASITAYGNAFDKGRDANGVLLIQTGQNAQAILDSIIEAMSKKAQGKDNVKIPVKSLQKEPFAVYSFDDHLFASVQNRELLLVGKSREQLDKARDIIGGKQKNMTSAERFSTFPMAPAGFFFLVMAEGFNENAELPPQAKVLQMADGIRIVLGEKAESLFANLALKANNAELTAQIQQVVQGMAALAALSQPDNQELTELTRSLKVSSSENVVMVNLEFPVAKALEKLNPVVHLVFPTEKKTSKDSSEK